LLLCSCSYAGTYFSYVRFEFQIFLPIPWIVLSFLAGATRWARHPEACGLAAHKLLPRLVLCLRNHHRHLGATRCRGSGPAKYCTLVWRRRRYHAMMSTMNCSVGSRKCEVMANDMGVCEVLSPRTFWQTVCTVLGGEVVPCVHFWTECR
jgi:hypothetical protein